MSSGANQTRKRAVASVAGGLLSTMALTVWCSCMTEGSVIHTLPLCIFRFEKWLDDTNQDFMSVHSARLVV